MSDQTDRFADFKAELRSNIIAQIAMLRRGGMVAMSERSLLQVTRTPRERGPIGTSARWAYAQMFAETVRGLPRKYRSFILDGASFDHASNMAAVCHAAAERGAR